MKLANPVLDFTVRILVKIVMLFLIVFPFVSSIAKAQTPSELLDRADRLAESFNLAKAQPLYRQAEVASRISGEASNELRAKLGQIRYRVQQGSYRTSREELRQILITPLIGNDPHLRIRVLEILGNIDLNQNTAAAQTDWTDILVTAKSVGDTKWINRANGYLGIVSGLNGDIGGAGKALFQAMGTAEKLGDIPAELTFGIWLANGMSTNGMADAAVRMLDRVAASAKSGTTDLPIQFSIAKVRALADSRADQARGEAKVLLRATLAQARQEEIPGAQTDLLSQAGQMEMEENQSAAAQQSFAEEVRVANKADLPSMEADGLLHLSRVFRSQQKNTDAEFAIDQGIDVVRRVEESYDLPGFVAEKAEVELALGRPKAADLLYDQATSLIEGLLINAPSSRVKSSMIGSMSEIYLGHFRLAWNYLHDGQKAFQIIESARGRALLATLGNIERRNTGIDQSSAEGEIAKLQSRLLHSRLSPSETKRVLVQLDRAYDKAFPLQTDQTRNGATQTTPISLKALMRKLSDGETLVEYVLDSNKSFALEVTNAGLTIHQLPGRAEIDQLTAKFLSAIKKDADARSTGTILYQKLIAGVVSQRPTSLIVVPDGSLHLIPMGALVDNDGAFLSQSIALSSAPSASVYYKLKSTASPIVETKPFLGVSYSPEISDQQLATTSTRGLFDLRGADLTPLPFASEEVNTAARILGSGSLVLDGAAASERALKTQPLERFKVIHLAAHAVGNDVEPDRAALVLGTGGGNEDGLWQAREIRRTTLNADVVVLSACETGVGRLQGEEGIMNLARAFLSSGAKSVLASLWSVEDRSTATVMESFYEHLSAGLSVSEALRQAQLDFIKTYGPKAKPSLWAGFEVIGDGTRRINFATTKFNTISTR